MTGDEFKRSREAIGASRKKIADLIGVSDAEVERWEDSARLRRNERQKAQYALWLYERDRAFERAGIPECPWYQEERTLEEIVQHSEKCELCQRRIAFVDENFPAAPSRPGAGLVGSVTDVWSRLGGWKKSAFAGGMLVVYVAGIGAPVMLLFGLIRTQPSLILAALGFLPLLFTIGAAGGIVHYLTTPLRDKGAIGYYLSFVLVVYGYLAAAGAIFWFGGKLLGSAPEQFNPADPVTWFAFGITGTIFGIVLGRTMRNT